MEKFNKWINNPKRDYLTGLALYNKHKLSNKHDAFFNVANPSQLHINMLLSRILKIFHILKTTGYFKNPANKPDQVTPKIKPISIKKQTNQKPVSTEAESPLELRSNKDYVNKLLTLEYSKLSFQDKLIFNNSEKYFLNKKQCFIANSDIDREMRGIHAKLKAIDESPENDEQRKDLMTSLVNLEDTKSENWITIDTWEEENNDVIDAALIEKKTLDKQRRIRANNVYINRCLRKLASAPTNSKKQIDKVSKMRAGIEKRKKELIELGSPYKEKS